MIFVLFELGLEDDGGVEMKRVMERWEGWKMLMMLWISVCKFGFLVRVFEEDEEENGRGMLYLNEVYDYFFLGVICIVK